MCDRCAAGCVGDPIALADAFVFMVDLGVLTGALVLTSDKVVEARPSRVLPEALAQLGFECVGNNVGNGLLRLLVGVRVFLDSRHECSVVCARNVIKPAHCEI